MIHAIDIDRKPVYEDGIFKNFKFKEDSLTDKILEVTELDEYCGSYQFVDCTFEKVYFDVVSVDDYIFSNCIFQYCQIETDNLYFQQIDELENQLIDCEYIEVFI